MIPDETSDKEGPQTESIDKKVVPPPVVKSAPTLKNPPTDSIILVQHGQPETLDLSKSESVSEEGDSIEVILKVDGLVIDSDNCPSCPIKLNSAGTALLMEASDYAFEKYKYFAIRNETI